MQKLDYNTVSELVDGYKGNSSVIRKWNHYSFITLYGSYYRRVNDIYNKNDMLSEYEFDFLVSEGRWIWFIFQKILNQTIWADIILHAVTMKKRL